MTNPITANSLAAMGANAASTSRPLATAVKDRIQTAIAIPNRIVELANAAARSLPASALAAKPGLKTEAAANANQNDKASKSVQTSNEGQFTVDWNLNKPEGKDKLDKAVIGNS